MNLQAYINCVLHCKCAHNILAVHASDCVAMLTEARACLGHAAPLVRNIPFCLQGGGVASYQFRPVRSRSAMLFRGLGSIFKCSLIILNVLTATMATDYAGNTFLCFSNLAHELYKVRAQEISVVFFFFDVAIFKIVFFISGDICMEKKNRSKKDHQAELEDKGDRGDALLAHNMMHVFLANTSVIGIFKYIGGVLHLIKSIPCYLIRCIYKK